MPEPQHLHCVLVGELADDQIADVGAEAVAQQDQGRGVGGEVGALFKERGEVGEGSVGGPDREQADQVPRPQPG